MPSRKLIEKDNDLNTASSCIFMCGGKLTLSHVYSQNYNMLEKASLNPCYEVCSSIFKVYHSLLLVGPWLFLAHHFWPQDELYVMRENHSNVKTVFADKFVSTQKPQKIIILYLL